MARLKSMRSSMGFWSQYFRDEKMSNFESSLLQFDIENNRVFCVIENNKNLVKQKFVP